MRKQRYLLAGAGIFAALFLFRTVNAASPNVAVLDGEKILAANLNAATPAEALALAGASLAPADAILVNGKVFPPDSPFLCSRCTVQIRHAAAFTLVTPDGSQTLKSAAFSLEEALWSIGIRPYAADEIFPLPQTPPRLVESAIYRPSREFTLMRKDTMVSFRSAAENVGDALAEAGIPIQGLDYTLPAESDPLPDDGQIRLVQVQEVIQLILNPLPYTSELQPAPDVELDQRVILQPGSYGIEATRVKIRYEDGVETLRTSGFTMTIKPPQNEIIGFGTKVVIRTMNTPNGVIEYWRAVPVYATSYSPCNSDADRCYYKTASGKPVQQGVVGVLRSWYLAMQGQPVYIPTYGMATIEDVGAGIPGKYWVDLGYTDEDYVPHHEWTTLYFLTPVPDTILWILP
jgi:uncharacterized protein YabE (DUF348 family)